MLVCGLFVVQVVSSLLCVCCLLCVICCLLFFVCMSKKFMPSESVL